MAKKIENIARLNNYKSFASDTHQSGMSKKVRKNPIYRSDNDETRLTLDEEASAMMVKCRNFVICIALNSGYFSLFSAKEEQYCQMKISNRCYPILYETHFSCMFIMTHFSF